jgi:RHS repeat-associated protein
MSVRIRKQDPFGNQRGVDTAGANRQSHTGFLGATEDNASGFVPLGARLYDPVVGRFLSADPVLDLNDVLQSNGYVYAHNNPVTFSDPTGLAISLTASERAAALAGAGLSAAQVAQAQAMMGKSLTSVILAVAWETLKDFIGINDAIACFGGDMWSCGSLIIGAIPWTKLGKIPSVMKAVNRTIKAIEAFRVAKKAAELVLKAAKAAEAAALRAKKLAIERAKKLAAQRAKKKAAEAAKRTADKAMEATRKTGNRVQKQAQAKAAPKVSSHSGGGGKGGGGGGSKAGGGGGSKPGGKSGGSSKSNGGTSGSGGSGKAEGDEPDGEVYYRTMSEAHYQTLKDGGGLSATAETFISPTREFSESYEGVLVRFTVKPGTTAALEEIGVRDASRATRARFPNMPMVGKGWRKTSAFFKGEGENHINIGLGGGDALELFNANITSWEVLRR